MAGRRQVSPETRTREPEEKFVVRLPATSMRMLRELAAVHERSVTAEVRLAMEAHVAAGMAEALGDPEFCAALLATYQGLDLDAVRARAERDAVVFRDAALARPTATRTLARAMEGAA